MSPARLRAASRIWVLCALLLGSACAKSPPKSPAPAPSTGGVIEVAPRLAGNENGLGEAWLGYALARRIWIDSAYLEANPGETRYRYSFPEEVYARRSMALIWDEIRREEDFEDAYLLDLVRIVRAGFIREYCWVCLNDPSWRRPDALREQAFREWFAKSMPEHRVESWVRVRQTATGAILTVGVRPHPPVACLNAGARDDR